MIAAMNGSGLKWCRKALACAALACLLGVGAHGQHKESLPPQLRDITIDQNLDRTLPLDLSFRDESGNTVRLGQYFGNKPVILSFAYYECPMLCTLILNGILKSLRTISLDIGEDFQIVNISIDPTESPKLAAAKRDSYVRQYGRPGAEEGWHFLTGDEAAIRAATEAAGYHYSYDKATDEYAHASAIMVLTPHGKFSKYFYGIEYAPRDLRLALVEASEEKIGTPVDRILLYCLHYDPVTGKYGVVINNVIRLVGTATALVLGGYIFIMFRRERLRRRRAGQ